MGKYSPVQNTDYKMVGDESAESGRGQGQSGWYTFASTFCKGQSVLDVGCGLGGGVEILIKEAKHAYGIDLDERLAKETVKIMNVQDVDASSVDAVTNIDVIEHVLEDLDFMEELVRVAKKQVLLSTPNYTAGRCRWPYHIREYMPHELVGHFSQWGKVTLYKGTPDAEKVYEVKYPNVFFFFNKLRVLPVIGVLGKLWNNLIPERMRILNHLFVRVEINHD